MKSQNTVKTMTIAALLSALGVLIPLVAPKYVLPPASYTLASHVPIFIAMFISVPVAIIVAVITGMGFLFAAYPVVIVVRALTHVIFAAVGSYILSKTNKILNNRISGFLYALLISLIHAVAEVIIVTLFYLGGNVDVLYYDKGYLFSVVLLVGVGTLVHSMVDFSIALAVWKPIQNILPIPANAIVSKKRTSKLIQ